MKGDLMHYDGHCRRCDLHFTGSINDSRSAPAQAKAEHEQHARNCPRKPCAQCGEPACKLKHDCATCHGEAVTQCDRGHLTCVDCRWQVGDGPDTSERCMECDSTDADRYYGETGVCEP
jgi:hypothetical protein